MPVIKFQFSQNPSLKKILFDTAGTTLAEASPVDRKWGIGLAADSSFANDRSTWRGENLLGQALTEVRDELMEEEVTTGCAAGLSTNTYMVANDSLELKPKVNA